MERDQEKSSIAELLGDFTRELRTILSDEIELARSEVTRKISAALKDGVYVAVGAAMLLTGWLALVATIIIVLSYGLPGWLAALIVTVVIAGTGLLFLQKGIADLRSRRLVPDQTIETLREDRDWVRDRVK